MPLTITSIDPSEKDAVFDFTKKWFFPSEPLCTSWKDVPGRDEVSYSRGLDQRLSLKIVDEEGNIAAICILADDDKLMENSPKTIPDYLEKLYNFFEVVESESKVESNLLSVLILSVADSYRRQGLSTKLLTASLTKAAENGYRGIKMLCTSKYSAAAAARVQWQCIYSKPYSEFKDSSGRPIYSPPQPHSHVSIYQKII